MNRILAGTLLTFALVGSAAVANAAPITRAAQPTAAKHVSSAQVDYTAQCKTLGEQWATALPTNTSHLKFATAKADAAKGERNCKSTNVAMRKKGAGQYETALKLIGVTPALGVAPTL